MLWSVLPKQGAFFVLFPRKFDREDQLIQHKINNSHYRLLPSHKPIITNQELRKGQSTPKSSHKKTAQNQHPERSKK